MPERVKEEDLRRSHRERDRLVRERTAHINRIKGLPPVRVARSMTSLGLKVFCAYHKASASTRRPSASVLITSTVCPDMEETMSPGRWAVPEGMFSTRPQTPTTLDLALRAASTRMRPMTTPAPPMAYFMSSMPLAGLIEIPPLSKVTPLPTRAIGALSLAFGAPLHCRTRSRGSTAEP